ncbi:BTB POZ domain containing protein [Musa troglodytarum]|uniref:BTB POZ domain containing protein n=4 Tax=Musa TaxID=4640 RepID=A0A9E7G851_9LILI|nr:BTB POZ domain containing protein [Musa troglodytarum]
MAAMPTPAAFDGPVVVVGPQFCAPHVVDFTVTRKAFSWTGNDFTVTDVNGNVVLKVKGVYFSLRGRRVLLDAAGKPLLTLQQKVEPLLFLPSNTGTRSQFFCGCSTSAIDRFEIWSAHQRWRVFRGESTDSKDLLFSVKKSRLLQFKTTLHVFMASNTNEDACDFKIKGSYSERSCTVYLGESDSILAQMRRKYTVKNVLLGKDTFCVTVYPNVDYAFVASLILILDEINTRSEKMNSLKSWVAEHKLTSIGAVWASALGSSLALALKRSPTTKTSLRLIHARMHAQALTLAVLSSAALLHYYDTDGKIAMDDGENVTPHSLA